MIREFQPRDINEIIAMAREHAKDADVTELLPVDDIHMTAMIKRLLIDDDKKCYVAEREGKIIGYALVGLTQKVWNPTLYGQVYFFFVHPELRNKHLADSLYNNITNWCKEQGCRFLEIGVTNFTKDFKGATEYIDRAATYYEHKGCELMGYNYVRDLEID